MGDFDELGALAMQHSKDFPSAAPEPVPSVPTSDQKIAQLAACAILEYEQCREAVAKDLKIRVSALDRLVDAQRPKNAEPETPGPFAEVEPWPSEVDGAALLADLVGTINRFCVLPEHSAPLMAVWVLHAWTHDTADISPILAFVSPEKRCGKTTALSVIGALVPKALAASNITTSVLFRVIEKYRPTILIDEADTFLTDNDELRGVLNGGHCRTNAHVWRSVGEDFEPKSFSVWAPKAIAMIGKLPDTIEDRALVVPLRRKLPSEKVTRFRFDRVGEFLPIRRRAKRWADDNLTRLRSLDPTVPDELDDRTQDNARAICAVADVVGGQWPKAIRTALIGLAALSDEDTASAGVRLLRDIRDVVAGMPGPRIGSFDLCAALVALDDAPWGEWWTGKPITARRISTMLKPFGVKARHDRSGSCYWKKDFDDAISRYATSTPSEGLSGTVTSVTAVTGPGDAPVLSHDNNNLDDNEECDTLKTEKLQSVTAVTGKSNENNGRDTCDACDTSDEGFESMSRQPKIEGGF